MEEVSVSIIIPVYNVEKYLAECLESVVKQTFNSIEIIAVNDGSTDLSSQILEKYAQKYNNVQIVNQKNQGLSEARNTGLKRVKGKYVYFLDSDDYIDLNMIEECFELAENKNLDIIHFDAQVVYESGLESKFNADYTRSHTLESNVYIGEDFYKYMIGKNAYRAPVWLSFYKVEYLKRFNLTFYKGIIHEDELFSAKAFLLAERVIYQSKSYYYRRLRKGSIMTQGKSVKNIEGYLTVANELFKLLETIDNHHTKKVLSQHILRFYSNCLGLSIAAFDNPNDAIKQYTRTRKEILRNYSIKEVDKKLLIKLMCPNIYIQYKKIKLSLDEKRYN